MLAVIVPIMLLSWCHVHEDDRQTGVQHCDECAQHIHHSHLDVANAGFDACPLCQFLYSTFMPAQTVEIQIPIPEADAVCKDIADNYHATDIQHFQSRAPPVTSLIS